MTEYFTMKYGVIRYKAITAFMKENTFYDPNHYRPHLINTFTGKLSDWIVAGRDKIIIYIVLNTVQIILLWNTFFVLIFNAIIYK